VHCEQFTNDGVVCPPKLQSSLFTTVAVDNIDYNLSSTTLKDSFHGTGISIIQRPLHAFQGHRREGLVLNQKSTSCSVAQVTQMYHLPLSSPKSLKYLWLMGLQCPLPFRQLQQQKKQKSNIDGSITEETVRQKGLDIMVCISCQYSGSNGSIFSY